MNDVSALNQEIPEKLALIDKMFAQVGGFAEKLFWVIIVFIIGLIIYKIIIKLTHRALQRTKIEPIVIKYIITCIRVLMWIILAITLLGLLGVPVTSLIALISAAGVAIALALQNSLSNLASGILIILTKPFSKGDLIDNLSVTGRIEEINLMHCKLHTLDNKTIIISNNSLLNGTIVNFSASGVRRVDCLVSIGYNADLDLAKSILTDIAGKNDLILQDKPIVVGVKQHNSSSIDLDFLVWCNTKDYWAVYYYLQEQTLKELVNAGVEIPFPQLDVHFKNQDRFAKMQSGE